MIFTLLFGSYEFPNQTFEVQGLPLENNIKSTNVPRKHGGIVLTPYLKERYFKIEGTIHNALSATSKSQLLDLQEALLAGEGALYYSADRYINCFARKIDPKFAEGTDKAVIHIGIDLVAQVPFLYSAGASYLVTENASGITYAFSAFSGGNVFSEPNIFFYASGITITNDILLQNLTTDKQMRWRGTLAPGQTLSVDVEDLEVAYGSFDGISIFEGDFLTLAAGTNSFQYVGANCRITIEHKWRWYA